MFNQFMQLNVCISFLCGILLSMPILAQNNTSTSKFTRQANVVTLKTAQQQYQFNATTLEVIQPDETRFYVFEFLKASTSEIRGEGPKSSTWSTGYNAIVYNNVYPNTRFKFYPNATQDVSYKWDIANNKALKAVKWKISDVDAAYLTKDGVLVLEKAGVTKHISPPAIQQIIKSNSGNSLHKSTAVFKLSSKNVLSINLPKNFVVNPNFPIYLFGTL